MTSVTSQTGKVRTGRGREGRRGERERGRRERGRDGEGTSQGRPPPKLKLKPELFSWRRRCKNGEAHRSSTITNVSA